MKKIHISILLILLLISLTLNALMFIRIENLTTVITNIQTKNGTDPGNNVTNRIFNEDLIGTWTDGAGTEFHVMNDGTSYTVYYGTNSSGKDEIIWHICYGYMDGNNFVYQKEFNGFDSEESIRTKSVQEIIDNHLEDIRVNVDLIILEGSTITHFGDRRGRFVRKTD